MCGIGPDAAPDTLPPVESSDGEDGSTGRASEPAMTAEALRELQRTYQSPKSNRFEYGKLHPVLLEMSDRMGTAEFGRKLNGHGIVLREVLSEAQSRIANSIVATSPDGKLTLTHSQAAGLASNLAPGSADRQRDEVKRKVDVFNPRTGQQEKVSWVTASGIKNSHHLNTQKSITMRTESRAAHDPADNHDIDHLLRTPSQLCAEHPVLAKEWPCTVYLTCELKGDECAILENRRTGVSSSLGQGQHLFFLDRLGLLRRFFGDANKAGGGLMIGIEHHHGCPDGSGKRKPSRSRLDLSTFPTSVFGVYDQIIAVGKQRLKEALHNSGICMRPVPPKHHPDSLAGKRLEKHKLFYETVGRTTATSRSWTPADLKLAVADTIEGRETPNASDLSASVLRLPPAERFRAQVFLARLARADKSIKAMNVESIQLAAKEAGATKRVRDGDTQGVAVTAPETNHPRPRKRIRGRNDEGGAAAAPEAKRRRPKKRVREQDDDGGAAATPEAKRPRRSSDSMLNTAAQVYLHINAKMT
ncbi:hypothetical protein DFJ74DRAFT_299196 [Hyaloraphidium curvatum]|nr:hypothetical protein DFJ74DRAFT_299196 [Hyaloraphidium curvatum]